MWVLPVYICGFSLFIYVGFACLYMWGFPVYIRGFSLFIYVGFPRIYVFFHHLNMCFQHIFNCGEATLIECGFSRFIYVEVPDLYIWGFRIYICGSSRLIYVGVPDLYMWVSPYKCESYILGSAQLQLCQKDVSLSHLEQTIVMSATASYALRRLTIYLSATRFPPFHCQVLECRFVYCRGARMSNLVNTSSDLFAMPKNNLFSSPRLPREKHNLIGQVRPHTPTNTPMATSISDHGGRGETHYGLLQM